ncbi:MAG: hypothetical protein K1X72_04330 [Pyrinomonadaceae bacterium]|nr:hypothetical protein [Pyrinomonadaceae bacterium]
MAKKHNPLREDVDNRAKSAIENARQRLKGSEDDYSGKPLSWWRERWKDKAIRRKFIETHIKISDALDENELVDFKFNDIQDDLWNKLTGKDAVLKMRRGGLSTLFQAICLAETIIKPRLKARSVPHDADTEQEFRDNFKVMFEGLKPSMKPPTKYYNEQRVRFKHNSEYLTQTVQPRRETKGRGLAIQILHLTEVAFWIGNQLKALIALLTAAEGGQVFVESTANGMEQFNKIYEDGKEGKGGWTSHFYQWWWRRNCRVTGATIEPLGFGEVFYLVKPSERFSDLSGQRLEDAKLTRREMAVALRIYKHLIRRGYIQKRGAFRDDWFRPEVAEYIAWRRAKIEDIGERDFLVDYPESDSECFENTGRPVIANKDLKVTCNFSEPQDGHEYLVSVDTSGGTEKGNPAAIQVIDICCGAQVFEEKLKLKPDLLGIRVAEVCDLYFRALIVVESNNTGIATINKLRELGYDDVLYRHLSAPLRRAVDRGDKTIEEAMEQAEFGFPTDAVNKPLAGMAIEKGVRTGELALASEAFVKQARKVVWKDNGSFSGQSSTDEDDLFMALAIGWFVITTMYGFFARSVGVLPEVGDAR